MSHARDFHSQSYNNPFFGRTGQSRWTFVLWFVVSLALFAGLAYVFIYSPFLRIGKINVSELKDIDPVRIKATVMQTMAGYEYLVIPKDHYFAVDSVGVKNQLLAQYPGLLDVRTEKKIGSIDITVEERQPTVRFIIGDKSYFLDQDSMGMRETAHGEGENLIAVQQNDVIFAVGKRMIQENWNKAVIEIHKYFATQVGIRDRLLRINSTEGTIEVVTTEGWYAKIDPMLGINEQLKTLSSALLGKFNSEERKKLLYIDIRFGDKVYYKWK